MSDFYTDVFLQKNHILLRGYRNGKRIKETIPFHPYLFIPAKQKSDYKTLEGNYVERIDFDSIYDARQFVDQYKDVSNFKIYGLTNYDYLFIFDRYRGKIDYDFNLISIVAIDVEVDSAGGFADIQLANKEITAITIRKNGKSVCFGMKDFSTTDPNIKYVKCIDERDLLIKFLFYWNKDEWSPDIITGWNIEGFDLPYIVGRLRQVLGDDIAKKLSPWERIIQKKVFVRGREVELYFPAGIQVLDYMQVYMKFSFKNQESFALDYIAGEVLGEKKLDYSEYGSLNELYIQNPQLYYEYNIRDCELIERMEDKLGMIKQIITTAYIAKVNYLDMFSPVKSWDCLVHDYLMNQNIVVPPMTHNIGSRYEGAFVKEPVPAVYDYVVSFDVKSMHPHCIISYNISPETLTGHLTTMPVEDILDGKLEKYKALIKKENVSVAGNMCKYRNDIHGVFPKLMQQLFEFRGEYRKRHAIAEKKKQDGDKSYENEKEIMTCDNTQQAIKIFLNSGYGALGNEYFRYYSLYNAEAITLSSQLVIRWIWKKMNGYLNKILKTNNIDYIIAGDTDSCYVNFSNVVKQICNKEDTKQQILDKIDLFCKKVIDPKIKEWFIELGEYCNMRICDFEMNREVIADRAVWRKKKNYILNVWDKEGIRYDKPKTKIVGIEAVKSSTPYVCRTALKELFGILMNKEKQDVIEYVNKFKSEFERMDFEQVAFPRAVKVLTQYSDHKTVYKKATPIHARAALLYNKVLKENKLDFKYPMIYNSDKIKWAYMKLPNPIGENVFAISTEMPRELGYDKYIDYELQFKKAFLDVVESITEIFGWDLQDKATLEDFFG